MMLLALYVIDLCSDQVDVPLWAYGILFLVSFIDWSSDK
jgi:hypothetical protein